MLTPYLAAGAHLVRQQLIQHSVTLSLPVKVVHLSTAIGTVALPQAPAINAMVIISNRMVAERRRVVS
jgi:hypothetical protein